MDYVQTIIIALPLWFIVSALFDIKNELKNNRKFNKK